METIFLDIFKVSPVLGLMAIMWFYQRKDYKELVEDTRKDGKNREEKLQITINKNQDIISDLANKFNVVEEVKNKVDDIEMKINHITEKIEK